MIDKHSIETLVAEALEGTDAFVVDIAVSPSDDVVVELDSPTGVDLDFCALLNRRLVELLDAAPGSPDYSLEVGSASLSAPFKVKGQYEKHLGDNVDILTRDGRKFTARLDAINDEGTEITVAVSRKVKEPGMKRPQMVEQTETLPLDSLKSVAYHFDFK
ncbi:MAG: ribosome assembly cofactor RimP [Duncaniella sp.]|nr:ribosome assembly cofactor RimP [Duncaniella sp.]